MGIFKSLKKYKPNTETTSVFKPVADTSQWTGNDFEFLIRGVIEIPESGYENIMTPNSFEWNKLIKNNGVFFQVGEDEFSYSHEMPGIQMTFNKEIPFLKAKQIADEVLANILSSGQDAELIIIDKKNIYRFD